MVSKDLKQLMPAMCSLAFGKSDFLAQQFVAGQCLPVYSEVEGMLWRSLPETKRTGVTVENRLVACFKFPLLKAQVKLFRRTPRGDAGSLLKSRLASNKWEGV